MGRIWNWIRGLFRGEDAALPQTCLECMKCCKYTVIPPTWPNERDPLYLELPEEFKREIQDAIERYGSQRVGLVREPCIFDTGNGCRIWDYVPDYCRYWPQTEAEKAQCIMFRQDKPIADLAAAMDMAEDEGTAYIRDNPIDDTGDA